MEGLGATSVETPETPVTDTGPTGLGNVAPQETPVMDILNADGTFKQDWTKNLSPDYQDFGKLANYKDIYSLVGSLVNADRTISKGLEKLPNTDSTPEEWNAFYAKLGRPEQADGYKFEVEGLDEQVGEWYKGVAHEAGLSQDQANSLLGKYAEFDEQRMKSIEDEYNAEINNTFEAFQNEIGKNG